VFKLLNYRRRRRRRGRRRWSMIPRRWGRKRRWRCQHEF
jgi:hypothetical protein